jgi:hypothetical protein
MHRPIAAGATAAAVLLALLLGAAQSRSSVLPRGQKPPANLTPPSVSGSAQVGAIVTASPGIWSGTALKYAYRWLRCDSAGAGCTAIARASASSYSLTSTDKGATVRVTVTASNQKGSASATSPATPVVTDTTNASTSSPPTTTTSPIFGTLNLGVSDVERWYAWYLGALVDEVSWQVQTYKSVGYTGYLYVLTPGLGSRPAEYQVAINNYLSGLGDGNATMGRAAAWDKLYAALPDKKNVVAYVSSLADWSGNPANNLCQTSDSAVGITDPQIDSWSAARWISYIAARYGMSRAGENPGAGSNYGRTMMQVAAQQAQACSMQGMLWAHDSNLYDPNSGVTLQDYATVIAQY